MEHGQIHFGLNPAGFVNLSTWPRFIKTDDEFELIAQRFHRNHELFHQNAFVVILRRLKNMADEEWLGWQREPIALDILYAFELH